MLLLFLVSTIADTQKNKQNYRKYFTFDQLHILRQVGKTLSRFASKVGYHRISQASKMLSKGLKNGIQYLDTELYKGIRFFGKKISILATKYGFRSIAHLAKLLTKKALCFSIFDIAECVYDHWNGKNIIKYIAKQIADCATGLPLSLIYQLLLQIYKYEFSFYNFGETIIITLKQMLQYILQVDPLDQHDKAQFERLLFKIPEMKDEQFMKALVNCYQTDNCDSNYQKVFKNIVNSFNIKKFRPFTADQIQILQNISKTISLFSNKFGFQLITEASKQFQKSNQDGLAFLNKYMFKQIRFYSNEISALAKKHDPTTAAQLLKLVSQMPVSSLISQGKGSANKIQQSLFQMLMQLLNYLWEKFSIWNIYSQLSKLIQQLLSYYRQKYPFDQNDKTLFEMLLRQIPEMKQLQCLKALVNYGQDQNIDSKWHFVFEKITRINKIRTSSGQIRLI